MKRIALPLACLAVLFFSSLRVSAQASTQDSLVLVDLYNSTNGPHWTNHSNWLTTAPLSTWFGVYIFDSVHVALINLVSNNLVGTLPSSLGNLTAQDVTINFTNNRISGSLPSSLVNLPAGSISALTLTHNQLSGPIPNFQQRPPPLLDISYNDFSFADLEPYLTSGQGNSRSLDLSDGAQADLPLIQNGNILSVATGGTLSNNTYTWYNNGVIVATKTGDSTFTTTGPGTYSVSVTNAVVPSLTLFSIQNLNAQDSLALIDLYNNTGGPSWIKNLNWATATPASSWNGVVARFGRVQQLYLPYNNLNGPLPSSLSNLTAAIEIDLGYNQLTGNIPSSFGSLQSLQQMVLTSNQLSGSIPPSLGNLSKLNLLYLDINQLTGAIPTTLGNLTSLTQLALDQNQLTGSIPAELGNISTLTVLGLSSNQLTDTIPASLLNLHSLSGLILNDNKLTGHIPDSLGRATNLIEILLQNNNLSGSINADLTGLNLNIFNIAGNQYNFSIFPLALPSVTTFTYSPQQNILLARAEDKLSVSAGGNTAHSIYTLFKDGASLATQTGDSLFTIVGLGNYNIVSTNTDAPNLTLYSDTLRLGLVLPDSSVTAIQTISGSTAVDINTNIFRIVTLTPGTGANALTGPVTALETVDSSIQTFNGAPYVERHYDITPTLNPTTSTATITLYYTQEDFDTYNAYVTAHSTGVPLLPAGGVDNGNVVITQYHGSFAGTSSPGNYSQGSEVIHPTVTWDATDGWWTVSFPVSGFSGFFLGSGSNPLPLNLLDFTATPQGYSVNLQWQTTDEHNTKQFIVQRSPDGLVFDPIGTVTAKNTTGQNLYGFTDNHPAIGNNFYRLKMQDINGQFTYSPIVEVSIADLPVACMAYPNPATGSTSMLFTAASPASYSIEISDLGGNVLSRVAGTSTGGLNKIDIDVHNFAPGTYTITLIDLEHGRRSIRLLKE